MICFGDVGEVLLVVGVDAFWICSSFFVPHVVPFWRGQSHLTLVNSFFGHDALQVVPLVDIGTPHMSDLASADDAFAGLVT